MSDLAFGVLAKTLQESFAEPVSAPDIILLLYDSVISPLHLMNQKGEPLTVSVDVASKIMNRRKGGDPLLAIKKNANQKAVLDTIDDYFYKNIVKHIYPQKIGELLIFFKDLVSEDKKISSSDKNNLLSFADEETLNKFLARIFLFTLGRKNALEQCSRKKTFTPRKTQGSLLNLKNVILPKPQVPSDIQKEEMPYIDALCAMYGQKHCQPRFAVHMLLDYQSDREDYESHRMCYYAAELVRRETRDINNGEDFECLKEEIWEGIREKWKMSYRNGYERLLGVLNKATLVQLDGCPLAKETALVKGSVRKGACHFLVNDGKISGWVRDDDGQTV